MKFPFNETITYPFTAYYHGYLADLGPSPALNAYVYSWADSQIVPSDILVDVVEISQVYDDVLFVGTIYINKLENTLPVGDYRLKLSVQTPSTVIDLLYAPITVVENDTPFYVSFLGRENLTPEEIRYHLRDVIDPGVKTGFLFSHGSESYKYNVGYGVLYTKNGSKIEHGGSKNSVGIRPAGAYSRVDAICIYYNQQQLDEEGSVAKPEFRVLEGIEDGLNIPPTIPENYTVIRYAMLPANTLSPYHVVLSDPRTLPGRRPFYKVPAIEAGDGVRNRFSFNVDFVLGTTEAFVDGIPQIRESSYKEIKATEGHAAIEFIGEVPQPGQRVALSGQRLSGPFYDHDYSPYASPAPAPAVVPPYHTSTLQRAFTGDNYQESIWVSSYNAAQFMESDNYPLRGWNAEIGHYASFSGDNRLTMPDAPELELTEFTVAVKVDFRDSPMGMNWMRILHKGTDFVLYFINDSTNPQLILDYFGSRLSLPIPRWKVDMYPSTICVVGDSGNMTLSYNDELTSNTFSVGANSSSPWRMGNVDTISSGVGLIANVSLMLMYNSALTPAEIANI